MATKTKTSTNGTREMHSILERYVYATGRFMEIPVADLFIDLSYQRDSDGAPLVDTIATKFSEHKFDPPLVNLRPDGVKAVVDGGHRTHAAERLGMDTITCRVIEIPPSDEPALFIETNRTRRWVTPVQTFKAELAAGNPAAIEINHILGGLGLRVAASHSPNTLSCTRTLNRIYTAGGTAGLKRVIRAALSWSEDEPRRFAGDLLQGLAIFFEDQPNADDSKLKDRLGRVTTSHLLAKASQRWHAWRSLDQRGGSKVEAIAEEIKKQYGKR